MKIEELVTHLQSMPAGSDVDVVGEDARRQIVVTPLEDDLSPIYLMLHAPEDEPPPAPPEEQAPAE